MANEYLHKSKELEAELISIIKERGRKNYLGTNHIIVFDENDVFAPGFENEKTMLGANDIIVAVAVFGYPDDEYVVLLVTERPKVINGRLQNLPHRDVMFDSLTCEWMERVINMARTVKVRK